MRKERNSGKGRTQDLQRALHTGLLLTQISMDWTRFMLRQTDLARNSQEALARLGSMAVDTVSASQAQAGGLIELMGHSIRVKAGLLRQASAAAQAPNLPESQSRWMGFWAGAFRLALSNANTLVQVNGAGLRSWWRLVQNDREAKK